MATSEQSQRDRARPTAPLEWPAAGPAEPHRQSNAPVAVDWRREVMSWSGLNVLAAIWLVISPFVLGYSGKDSTWNPIVFGAIVGVLALVRLGGAFRASVLSWINMAIGVWLFISAWWLADTARAVWNVGILGVVVFVFAALSASATEDAIARQGV
jgi:hypothetical protein